MASKENLTALKTLVISMGFLLVGGTVLLAGIVWKKVNADIADVKKTPVCDGGQLDLRGNGMITDLSVQEQIVQVKTEQDNGKTSVYRVDLCTGELLTTLTLTADPDE